MIKQKKGVFFSIDALIALSIIFLTILAVYPLVKYSSSGSEIEKDVIRVLSTLKVGEIENPYIQSLVTSGQITDLNNTLLEQIGEFYINDIETAKAMADSILSSLNTSENIGIWYGTDLLASKNSTPIENAANIKTERQIISGINGLNDTEDVTGYSARAFLTSGMKRKNFYFGGYVGEGNISLMVNYEGTLHTIILEIASNTNFSICINDEPCSGYFEPAESEFIPKIFDLSAYAGSFNNGSNIIKLKPVGEDSLYIAGGYLKINYENTVQYQQPTKYYFPGIEGLINLYDGFYIPTQLNSMNINLHVDNNYSFFMTIGDVTVFNGSTNGEEIISINDNTLSSMLNYGQISGKTVPLRIGLENASYSMIGTKDADVFSVTDLSGSMAATCSGGGWWCCLTKGGCNNQGTCEICGGIWEDKIGNAKNANIEFINSVLNDSDNRAGLVGYSTDALLSDFHSLSSNNVSLIAEISSWSASGSTCICCGINRAKNSLLAESSEDKFRSMVVMSDGAATVYCSNFDDYTGSGTGSVSDAIDRQWAINSACHAWQEHGIRVYAIGFGNDADETTLQQIANCGNGSYYKANISNLIEVYKQIASEIIEAAYKEQTIIATGSGISTILYPDSYIEFDYDKQSYPYGLIITSEKKFDDAYSGSFLIPENSTITEAKAISYSGPRWTNEVILNNNSVYKLSDYGSNYIELGDPYSINLPVSLVNSSNNIRITTGVSPTNSTYGSEHNKIIYSILRNMAAYSGIRFFARGCIWNLTFEDNSNLNIPVPSDYSGTDICYYDSGTYNDNDAIQEAVYNLLKLLDYNNNGKIDVIFTEQDLQITNSEITGIPYDWSTEVQVRKWY